MVANFVETVEGAHFLCQSPKLLEVPSFFAQVLRVYPPYNLGHLKLLGRYEKLEMDEGNVHLLENASYATQGLKQKVPDELDRLGISFATLALQEKEAPLSSTDEGSLSQK